MSATKADIPVETLILHVTLQKNQLNLMGLVHAMRSNGLLPQVLLILIFLELISKTNTLGIVLKPIGCIIADKHWGHLSWVSCSKDPSQ
jgi:hypothetical protein